MPEPRGFRCLARLGPSLNSAVYYRLLSPRDTLLGSTGAALENGIVDPLEDGALCWVNAENALYYLDKESLAAPAPPLVIATSRGAGVPGRWIRAAAAGVGPTGDTGPTGDAGPTGDTGPTGNTGPTGEAPYTMIFGNGGGIAAGEFMAAFGAFDFNVSGVDETASEFMAFRNGTLSQLRLKSTVNVTVGDLVAVVRVNETDTLITATIPNGGNSGANLVNSVAVNEGDRVSIQIITTTALVNGIVWAQLIGP